jgi:hypothetical protein
MQDCDLDYVDDTCVGPLSETRLRAFENWLHESGYLRHRFDEAYIHHLKTHHGGVPRRRYFAGAKGTKHVVTRFLNFLPRDSRHPLGQKMGRALRQEAWEGGT